MYRLADKYDYVNVEVYGTTHEKRELMALHINKNDKDEVVFLNSLIHAREWVVGCVTMNIIHRVIICYLINQFIDHSISKLACSSHED